MSYATDYDSEVREACGSYCGGVDVGIELRTGCDATSDKPLSKKQTGERESMRKEKDLTTEIISSRETCQVGLSEG